APRSPLAVRLYDFANAHLIDARQQLAIDSLRLGVYVGDPHDIYATCRDGRNVVALLDPADLIDGDASVSRDREDALSNQLGPPSGRETGRCPHVDDDLAVDLDGHHLIDPLRRRGRRGSRLSVAWRGFPFVTERRRRCYGREGDDQRDGPPMLLHVRLAGAK